MPIEGIAQALEHLPSKTLERLTLSGGEVFTAREELEYALNYATCNRDRLFPLGRLAVQTNGSWALDEEACYEMLKMLSEFGVDELDVASRDKYHREQGCNTRKIEQNLKKARKRFGLFDSLFVVPRYEFYGCNGTALPFGRGEFLPQAELAKSSSCPVSKNYIVSNGFSLAVNPAGQAYICCWEGIPPIRSALETPIEELTKEAIRHEIFGALLRGGPKEAAKALGVFDSAEKFRYDVHPCKKCKEIFKALMPSN